MLDALFVTHMVNALAFSILGIVILVLGFVVIDWWSPYDLWKEIVEEQNVALGVMVAGFAIAVGLVIGAAIHG